MTVAEAYSHYQLTPALQTHQLRVAGVVAAFLEFTNYRFDVKSILSACLLHDMGNILKFNLELYPELLEPEGKAYWTEVQEKYKARYGNDEHFATQQIMTEIGVTDRVKELVNAIGFSQTKENFLSGDLEKMLCEYADDRVTPWRVVSLDERIEDLRMRYSAQYSGRDHEEKRLIFADFARKIEDRLFTLTTHRPDEITETLVQSFEPDLRAWRLT